MQFWQQPIAVNDIFTLFTASEIRQTRDKHKENLETFILALTARLFYLFNHSQFPHPEIAPAKELLNCVRLLTRILPFVFEQKGQSPETDRWIEEFFWGKRRVRKHITGKADLSSVVNPAPAATSTAAASSSSSEPAFDQESFDRNAAEFYDAQPLGEQLVDTALSLLFCPGFTVPRTSGSSYSIWETGVGCTTPINSTGEQDSNKIEILRFLLALISERLYTSSSALAAQGSKFLTYTVTQTNRRMAMAILCSLLNTTLKYSPRWEVPYDHMLVSDGHKVLITYSLQYLEALLIYPIPKDTYEGQPPPKNIFRQLCSKIHKVEDLQFIGDSLIKMLSQPIHASFSYLPGSRQENPWATELAMLFWDLIQCNKRFKAFLIGTERMYDCLIILLYYIHEKSADSCKASLVRLCAYELLYLTAEPTFASSLSKKFAGRSLLPSAIQLTSFNGSYGDYLIIQLIKTITAQKPGLDFLIPTLLDCILNVAPYTKNICYQAASSLVQLCATISNPSFLFANESNHLLLETVLKSVNFMIECNFTSNGNLVFLIMKNERVFLTIRSLTLEDDVERILIQVSKKPGDAKISSSYAALQPSEFVIDDEISDTESLDEKQIIEKTETLSLESLERSRNPELKIVSSSESPGPSSKNKGKGISDKSRALLPEARGLSPYSGKNGEFLPAAGWVSTWLPLLPIYTITAVISHLKETIPYFKATHQTLEAKLEPSKAIESIARMRSVPGVVFYESTEEDTPARLPSDFEPSRFSWNSGSLGWYESVLWGCIFQAEREVTIADSSNMMIHTNNCMPVGVWNNTNIKLFRLQETAPRGPSLLRPKGAVDAVAQSMMQKIGQFGRK